MKLFQKQQVNLLFHFCVNTLIKPFYNKFNNHNIYLWNSSVPAESLLQALCFAGLCDDENKKANRNKSIGFAPPTSPELNPLYDSLRKIYDLSQILKDTASMP